MIRWNVSGPVNDPLECEWACKRRKSVEDTRLEVLSRSESVIMVIAVGL
jgi:hypothetical protein